MNHNSKKAAQAFGDKILPTLKGKGWEIRVWENLGWHVCWHLRRIHLHVHQYDENEPPAFSCLVSNDNGIGGCGLWTTNFVSEDPNAAVEHEFGNALDVATKVKNGLTKTKQMLTGGK